MYNYEFALHFLNSLSIKKFHHLKQRVKIQYQVFIYHINHYY